MPKKNSVAGSNPTYGDPPGDTDPKTLLARIADVDKQIKATQDQIREIPLMVLGPQVDEALARVRGKLAALAIAPTRPAAILARFPVGSKATVEMSPARVGIVLRGIVDPETGRDSRILLLEDGSTVIASTDELREPGGSQVLPGSQPSVSPASPTSPTPGGIPQATTSGIQPGDTVDSPLGRGRVEGQLPGVPGVYTVNLTTGGKVYVHSADLRLVTP